MAKDNRGQSRTLAQRVSGAAGRLVETVGRRVALDREWARQEAMRRQGVRAFGAYRAGVASRLLRHRTGLGGSADRHASKLRLDTLRNMCRDQERNSPFTAGILTKQISNIGGHQFAPQALTDDDDFNRRMEERFRIWAEGECDVRGQLTLWDMLDLIAVSPLRDGDCGFAMLSGPEVKGRLQAFEAEQICNPSQKAMAAIKKAGNKIANGIEMNKYGRPQAYWVANYVRGGYAVDVNKASSIAAKDFIHLYRPTRFSQSRGVPLIAPILDDLQMMDQYLEAELVNVQVAACFAAVRKTAQGPDFGSSLTKQETDAEGNVQVQEELEPGIIMNLLPGESMETIAPTHPPGQLPEFMTTLTRFCFFSLGLPLEIFDPGKTNYSGGRTALLQAYRVFRGWQTWIVDHFLARVYRWKASQFIKYGDIDAPKKGEKREWAHTWILPGWEWIDPQKEVMASIKAVDRGLTSIADECAARGRDWENVMRQNQRAIKLAQELAEDLGIDWHELLNAALLKGKG